MIAYSQKILAILTLRPCACNKIIVHGNSNIIQPFLFLQGK